MLTPDDADFNEAAELFSLDAHIPTRDYLDQMWDRRAFAMAMPLEEVRSTHQDTLLGNVWHLANPLLSVAVYYLVFGVFLNANRGVDNYVLWLMVGVFTFGLTTRSVVAGASTMTANVGLMRSMRFPRALLPISTVFGRLLTFGFELVVIAVVAVLTGQGLSRRVLVLPIIIVVHTALNLGLAFIAARLNDTFRDVQQLIPFLFRLLMYVSGVMIPIGTFLDKEGVSPLLLRVVTLNPMVSIINLYRWVFLDESINVTNTLEMLGLVTVTLVFGFGFFRARELKYGRS